MFQVLRNYHKYFTLYYHNDDVLINFKGFAEKAEKALAHSAKNIREIALSTYYV